MFLEQKMYNEILSKIEDTTTRQPVVGMKLLQGISNKVIQDEYLNKWMVEIDRIKAAQGNISNRKRYQNQRWATIVTEVNINSDIELFRLEFNGELQAMMALSMRGYPYPEYEYPEINKRNKLIYLRNLEVAPWNQSMYENLGLGQRKFVGVGIAMLNCVRIISKSAGYDECFGLHALTQAESFYKKLSKRNSAFNRIGSDSKRVGYKDYYEFDPTKSNEKSII